MTRTCSAEHGIVEKPFCARSCSLPYLMSCTKEPGQRDLGYHRPDEPEKVEQVPESPPLRGAGLVQETTNNAHGMHIYIDVI